jgi:hypothetical protein
VSLVDDARGFIEHAVADLEGEDDFMPFMTYRRPDGPVCYVGLATMGDAGEKDRVSDIMAAILAAHSAVEAVFASAAWMVRDLSAEVFRDKPPSEHPMRIESAFMIHVTRDGDAFHTADIMRAGDRVTLSEWMVESSDVKMGGRFSDAMHMGMRLGATIPDEVREYIEANLAAGDFAAVLRPMANAFASLRQRMEDQGRAEQN